jgi:hypothetical protein
MPRKTQGLEQSNEMAESGKRQLIQRVKKNYLIDRLITVYNAPIFPLFYTSNFLRHLYTELLSPPPIAAPFPFN